MASSVPAEPNKAQSFTANAWVLAVLKGKAPFRKSELDALMAAEPEWVRAQDEDGDLPIHWACRPGAPKELATTLIAAYPEGVRVRNKEGQLPLHCACGMSGTDLETVRPLLEAWPEAAAELCNDYDEEVKGRIGQFPVVYAAMARAKPDLILELLRVCPECGQGRMMEDGSTLLAIVVALHEDLTALPAILKAEPTAASEADYPERRLPLHVLLHRDKAVPVDVLQALIEAYPDALMTPDGKGNLPLHLALAKSCHCTPAVVARLLKGCPESATERGVTSELPVVNAVSNTAPLEVVRLLLEAYPHGAQPSPKDKLPALHLACLRDSEPGVIEAVLAASPEVAKQKDAWGRLPLDIALSRGGRVTIAAKKALLKAYPEAAAAIAGTDADELTKVFLHDRVDALEAQVAALEAREEAREEAMAGMAAALARLEARLGEGTAGGAQ